jgi:PKD domain
MMSLQSTQVPRRIALLACVLSLAALGVFSSVAAASSQPWGELGNASLTAGTGTGQINLALTTSFVADPSDGGFYVAHELNPGAQPKFEIQRFNAKGEEQASIAFTPPAATKTNTGVAGEEIELAVDPARQRVYALIVDRRRETDEKEEKELEKEEEQLEKEGKKCGAGTCYERFPLDSDELAAGELYAFFYQSGKLTPAKESEGEAAPVAGENTLNAQGEHPKEAILNPHGLAVEPSSGDLAIVGDEDEQEDANVEKGASQKCRAIAQYVTIKEAAGKMSGTLGARYVDNKEVLEELGCEKEESENLPYSPILTSGGKLLAEETRSSCPGAEECNGGEVWELPKSTNKIGETAGVEEFSTAPREVYSFTTQQELVQFGPEGLYGGDGLVGPTMSYVPDSASEGKIYLSSEVHQEGTTEHNGSVLVLAYSEAGAQPEASELGWTGGGHEAGGAQGCLIPRPGGQTFLVGGYNEGGGKEGVLAFDAFTHEKKGVVQAIQFGTGGSTTGCPHVTLTPPSVKANGVAVSKLVPGESATFSSTLSAANAVSTEWRFENTKTRKVETVSSGYEFETPSLTHAFSEEGTYKLTEIVHTDNLAASGVEAELPSGHEFTVRTVRPEFEISSVSSLAKGEEANFEATVTDENKQVAPLKFVWKFGDGSEEKGETSGSVITATHLYSALCASCAVTLEVTDKEGTTGTATTNIVVHQDKAEEETQRHKAEEEAAAKRKAEEEAAAKHKAEEEAAAKHKAEEEAKQKEIEHKGGGGTGPPPGGGAPEAKLAVTTLSVSSNGALALKVTCPSGESSCIGSVTLRTLSAVSVSAHKKKAILTLASGSFSVVGGQVKVVSLHLSSAARALLAHAHVLRVRATLLAHDAGGASHTTTVTVTLRAAKTAHKKH